jgi:hypothetical protein
MSDSETSVKRDDKLLEFKKPQSTDTDLYFNMIGNTNKVIDKNEPNSATSELDDIKEVDSDKSSDSSRRSSPKSSSRKNSPRRDSPRTHSAHYSPSRSSIPQFPKVEEKPPVVMSAQESRMKKIELLRRLSEIKTKGYKLSKEYDFNSSIEEMQYEYDLLKSFAEKRNGIKLYKNILLNVTSAVEFVNEKYDPFDFHLSGWSEHLSYDIDSYDDVLEDLYEKYKGTGKKMPPEIKLLLLIISSASAFHFTKSQSNTSKVNMGGANILGNLMNNKKDSSQFMTEQELNIEKLRNELKNTAANQKAPPQQPQQQQQRAPQQQQQRAPQPQPQQNIPLPANMKPHLPSPKTNVQIKAPENVKDILSRIHNLQASKINNTDTQDESANNDRIISDSTYSESKKKTKKANISIF